MPAGDAGRSGSAGRLPPPVHHSHSYSIGEEFRRYFDVGVMHARAPWLLDRFGKAEGEGKRFVQS
ncbi:hypothetical protein ACFW26_34910, partial [Streptomyces sp. NPDC058867]